jgi:hypothetical protein
MPTANRPTTSSSQRCPEDTLTASSTAAHASNAALNAIAV